MAETLRAFVTKHSLESADLPSELRLLAWGKNETDRGVLVVNDRTQDAIARQRKDAIYDRVIIDFEHSSCRGHPNYVPPPRRHAGVGYVFCDPNRGLGLEGIQWTPSGREYAAEYPDISPVVIVEEGNVVVGLVSAGLVPNGGVKGLSFFDAIKPEQLLNQAGNEDDGQLWSKIKALQTTIEELAKKLSEYLRENEQLRADRDQLAKALEELRQKIESAAEAQAIQALEAKVADLSNHWTAELEKRDKEQILRLAAAQGKVVALTPEAIAKLSVDDLAAHVAALPANQVPMKPVALAAERSGVTSEMDARALRELAERYAAAGMPWQRAWARAEKEIRNKVQ